MYKTSKNTAIVTSTSLKRSYREVQKLLKSNVAVIITNRNNPDAADGIILPYSEAAVAKIQDFIEDIEMEENKEKLEKEFKRSIESGNKQRISLDDI